LSADGRFFAAYPILYKLIMFIIVLIPEEVVFQSVINFSQAFYLQNRGMIFLFRIWRFQISSKPTLKGSHSMPIDGFVFFLLPMLAAVFSDRE
jgi:hypothetical protein